jgi:hypothetical protein
MPRSDAEVCNLLTLPDNLRQDDFTVELDDMPWAVKHLHFSWVKVAALHCDGSAILDRGKPDRV